MKKIGENNTFYNYLPFCLFNKPLSLINKKFSSEIYSSSCVKGHYSPKIRKKKVAQCSREKGGGEEAYVKKFTK